MELGNWRLNGEAILFTESGVLADGQHRLEAISRLKSDIAIPMLIGLGLPEDSFDTINTGKTRSASDLLSIYGMDARQSNILAAGAKLLHSYQEKHANIARKTLFKKEKNKKGVKFKKIKELFQNKDVYDFINKKENKDLFKEAAVKVLANKESLPLSPSECVFFSVLFTGLDAEKGRDFCDQLFTALPKEAGSPVHILLKKLNVGATKRPRINKRDRMTSTIICWNAFVKGEVLSKTSISTTTLISKATKIAASPPDKSVGAV